MKRPLSPVRLPMSPCTDASGERQRRHHERKKPLYSLCQVCNIQLNSEAQAQVHYNGRSHLRRVRQLDPAPAGPTLSVGCAGSSCQSSALPGLLRSPPLMMQSNLDVKPFLSFPVDAASPVGLFPNFNTMDPVQKAVINHTFGVSIPGKKKQVISCSICQLRFNSDSQAEAHYKGSKHAKKLKAQESTQSKQRRARAMDNSQGASSSTATSDPPERTVVIPVALQSTAHSAGLVPVAVAAAPSRCKTPSEPNPASPPVENTVPPVVVGTKACTVHASATTAMTAATTTPESEEEKAKKLLYCSLCKVAVNSLSQLEAHNTGSKHKTMLEARNGAGPIKAYPRPGSKLKLQTPAVKGSGLQNKTFHCEICDVHVNSEIQLKQHISSRRHKDRVAGKPLKPKYSPYSKQRSAGTLTAKVAFQKELVKPLSPAFMSSPFTPVPLTPRPGASLFQTAATLSAPFLRPAPTPLRPATGSLIFPPY